MSFYEELGVPQDASPDTIREAYRNVAKVLHPDAQTNPVLKECAEGQMKRMNLVYEVLSDPDRRRKYDQELSAPHAVIIQAPAAVEQSRNRSGTWIWLTATVLCFGFVYWLATRDAAPAVIYAPPVSTIPAAPPVQRPAIRGRSVTAQPVRQFQAPVPVAQKQPPQPVIEAPASISPPAQHIDLAVPGLIPVAPPLRWAGSWLYTQRTRNKDKALCPPEYIETVIRESNGELHGRYHGRFEVAGARLSPEVDFQFEGKVSGSSGRFSWTGPGGAKGEVQLKLLSDSAMEVAWSATNLGTTMGLASGTAVLNRR